MLFPVAPGQPRDMEDTLRSLGAVLDSVHARHVLVREAPWGLMLRAQVAASLQDRLEDRWRSIDRDMSAGDLARYRREAVARRGSGHVAGAHERSLRMIGRHIDEGGLQAVTLIQHRTGAGWLLWHGTSAVDGPSLVVLEDDRLMVHDAREAEARAARQRAEAIAMEVAHSRGR
jgi:hypothetical protein